MKRKRVSMSFEGVESMTKQAFEKGTRVESVLKKYATIGVDANDVGVFQAHVAREAFGYQNMDLDYMAQLNRVLAVQDYFKRLPSAIRDKFRHEPGRMIAFLADPANTEEARKLGLLPSENPPPPSPSPAPPPPSSTPVVPPTK